MTKIISLSDKAYERLKGLKQGKESFSDVVLRVTCEGKGKSILEFAGIWKDSPETERIFNAMINEKKNTKIESG